MSDICNVYHCIICMLYAVALKYSLLPVNENNIVAFVKLRNNKTHFGTVDWGESAKIYAPL